MFAAGLMTAASVAVAGPAVAATAPVCGGTDGTIVVCVEPFGYTYFRDCVYTGEPECEETSVMGPSFRCTGEYGSVCYGEDEG